MKEQWLNRLDRKLGRYAIPNLMTLIVGGMAIVYLMDWFVYPMTGRSMQALLSFSRSAILRGQLWRLITFIFIPTGGGMISLLFSLYFYWLIGSALENQWGTFRFNAYYFCGMIGAIISGMITGYAANTYLNLSLLLGFAVLYPDFQILLFFILPIKIKYLALLDVAGLAWMFLTDSWSGRIAMIFALANVILFFWNDFMRAIRQARRRRQFKKDIGDGWR